MGRKPRARTTYFDPVELYDGWKELARLRDPGFDWTGADYGPSKRGLAVDVDGISHHMAPLSVLLNVCKSGFPSQGRLKQTLEKLHREFMIVGDAVHGTQVDAISSTASDKWRILCKDVYRLKQSAAAPPHLGRLTDLIEADGGDDERLSPRGSRMWPQFPSLESLSDTAVDPDSGSEGDVEIVHMDCKCIHCASRCEPVCISEDDDEVSMAVPSAIKGGRSHSNDNSARSQLKYDDEFRPSVRRRRATFAWFIARRVARRRT